MQNKISNLNVLEEFSGDRNKDGVIIKCANGFNFYDRNGDNSLKPIKVNKTVTRSKDGTSLVKTSKVFEPVSVANNQMTVTVYPNGKIEIVSNS